MQLPHRPPMSTEEIELIKAKTRQTNLWTWLASLNMAMMAVVIGIPLCMVCVACVLFVIIPLVVAGQSVP